MTNKKKYEFTNEEINDIIEKYKTGFSCNQISNSYPCSSKTIERLLKRVGLSSKDNPNNIFIKDLPEKDKRYIIDSFINGISATTLGKEFDCGETAIRNFLKQNNITYNDAKHCHYREFSKEEIEDVIERYKMGIALVDLSKDYNCNYKTINKLIPKDIKNQFKIFKYNGNKFRKFEDLTIYEKDEIKNKYLNGSFQKELSSYYNCSIDTIKKVLSAFNIFGKDNPKYNYNISKSLENNITEIIELYNSGTSINQLSEKYNVGNSVISKLLINNNISIRQGNEYCNYTEEELLEFLNVIYDEYGYVNTELLNTLKGFPTSLTYNNRFGSFKNAVEKANIPYNTQIRMLDDEVCKSGFEYRLSLVLRKYNIEYEKDFLYKNIIPNYDRRHSIDYVVHYKNKIIYVEIFGMVNSSLSNGRYDKTKVMKLDLCKKYNVKLLELYPDNFRLTNKEFEKHILQLLDEY